MELLPVLLVHGIFDSGTSMQPLRRDLQSHGWPAVHTIDLVPNDASEELEILAHQLSIRVEEICEHEKANQLDIAAFSMGGLATRHYIRFMGGNARVKRLVTVSSPHHGTWMAYLSKGKGAQQMRPGSKFLQALNAEPDTAVSTSCTSIWTPLDLMVIPAGSSRLPGAANRTVLNPAHPLMLRDPRVFRLVREALDCHF